MKKKKDLLPKEQIKFNKILDKIRNICRLFGLSLIDTPIMQKADILLAKSGGDTTKQIYRFKKGKKDLALRFDLTVPLAYYVAQNYNDLVFPFKVCQIGKVFRGERQQKGRFREFYQCDFDIIDNQELDLINDAEIISIIYNIFKKLNLGDFVIKINNRKILNQPVEILRIIDKISKIGELEIIKELEKLEINKDKINQILEFIKNSDPKNYNKELKQVLDYLKKLNIPEENIKIDFSITRGLDYYTGTVFEVFLKDYPEIGCVCGGGRYDNLAGTYTDKKLQGVGASIGLTRLFSQLKSKNKKIFPAKVLVASITEDIDFAVNIADKLRDLKIKTLTYFDPEIKIKKKFAYADKLNIPYVIAIGDDEIKNNKITLKNMKTGEQKQILLEKSLVILERSDRISREFRRGAS